MKVLVVDEQTSTRKLIKAAVAMKTDAEEVREAGDGLRAITVARDMRPDVLLVDDWLPSADGDAVARQLRRDFPRALIIAVSAVRKEKPPWADHLFRKSDLAEVDELIDLIRGA